MTRNLNSTELPEQNTYTLPVTIEHVRIIEQRISTVTVKNTRTMEENRVCT